MSLTDDSKKLKIVETLSLLPYKVLWKFESENGLNTSDNVLVKKWFPQQDVLNHKNVKVFVTQGGFQSAEEAMHYRVPMVVLPMIADQHQNAKSIQELGIGITLDVENFTSEDLKEAIVEVMQNPR